MIEVSLYSVPTGSNINTMTGKCVDRSRFDVNSLGTNVMSFVKGFLKTNLTKFETVLANPDIISLINDNSTISTADFASINYWLARVGFVVKIWNVADDEDNPVDIPAETTEWNIIDYNFIQYDYPTVVKIIPVAGNDVVTILKQAITTSNLFRVGKNPLNELIDSLEKIKNLTGNIDSSVSTRIYDIFDQVGLKAFLAIGE